MWPFGNSAQQKRIDELVLENRQLRDGMEGADATAVMYSDMLNEERRQHETTRAQLKVFTDRRDRAKLNLKQFRGSGAEGGSNEGTVLNA